MRTITDIAATIDVTALPDYRRHLVYVDYRDSFDQSQVEEILRGGWSEHTDDWISERQWESAHDLADELFFDACEPEEIDAYGEGIDWRESDERVVLVETLCEHDTSNPYRDLMSNTGPMLFRYSPNEDHMIWLGTDDTAESIHAELGLADDLLPAVRTIWPEIEGYTISGGAFGASIVFSANPADLWEFGPDATIEVTDPFLWLCNPWQGNGWGEVAEGVTVTLKMADVHTDRSAWGYSADEVFGGLCLDESTITECAKEDA